MKRKTLEYHFSKEIDLSKNLKALSGSLAMLTFASMVHADDTMTKVVTRQEAPNVTPGSFAALPKTLYVWRPTKGRVEEAPDVDHHLTELMVVNGKDAWIVNLYDHTGNHIIDYSPTHNFYAPIIPPEKPDSPPPVKKFQIGHELEFMASHHVVPRQVSQEGRSALLYETIQERYTLRLYIYATTGIPFEADVLKSQKIVLKLIYIEYLQGLPGDPSLFQPPAGVQISEAKS